MAYRILVPLDGTEIGQGVTPYLRKIVLRSDAVVTLLHVLPDLTDYSREHVVSEHGRAATHVHQFTGRLGLDPEQVHCEFRMGNPADEILKYAALDSTALIVMPTHGRTGIKRLLSGSVTESVMRKARCPVLLSHAGSARRQTNNPRYFSRILVPLDGTRRGYRILPVIEDFARLYDSEIILFHDNRGFSDSGERLENDGVLQQLEEHRRRMTDAGITVRSQLADKGRLTEDILEAASDTQADLIAMTTHGRRGLDRVAYGSIVENVLRKASRPMLVMCTDDGMPTEITEKYLG